MYPPVYCTTCTNFMPIVQRMFEEYREIHGQNQLDKKTGETTNFVTKPFFDSCKLVGCCVLELLTKKDESPIIYGSIIHHISSSNGKPLSDNKL